MRAHCRSLRILFAFSSDKFQELSPRGGSRIQLRFSSPRSKPAASESGEGIRIIMRVESSSVQVAVSIFPRLRFGHLDPPISDGVSTLALGLSIGYDQRRCQRVWAPRFTRDRDRQDKYRQECNSTKNQAVRSKGVVYQDFLKEKAPFRRFSIRLYIAGNPRHIRSIPPPSLFSFVSSTANAQLN